MAAMSYDLDDLTQFGIRPADEFVHPAAPDEPFWNESVFYDWIASPTLAGHVRIARMPNQGRAWVWVYLFVGDEWFVLEEPRLPIEALGDGFDYDGPGLRIRRSVPTPLSENRLEVSGMARVVCGRRSGQVVPFEIDLHFDARGPLHSLGEQTMAGHSAEAYSSNRFEQPVSVSGKQRVGTRTLEVIGHGERDHSWGPRYWNMEWYFLVLHGEAVRLQCARVVLDEDSELSVGYVSRDHTEHVVETDFALTFDDEDIRSPYAGTVRLVTEQGETIEGRIESLDGCEMDASHCFDPPQPSIYRRAIVRFHPNDGSEPILGWLEVNRFPEGISDKGHP